MLVTDPELHEVTTAAYVADPVCRHFGASEDLDDSAHGGAGAAESRAE